LDITIERITPSKAAAYLNANKSNRKLREGVAERYAHDMTNGHWTECPEPISFYADGDLADGQHRLWAIIMSETTQTFPVARGLDRESGLNLNTGLNRSLVDNAKISGLDRDLSNELISVARAINEGTRNSGLMSNADRLEIVDRHREAAKFAISHGPRGSGLRNQLVLAAFARAWYCEANKDRLKRCAEVMSTGMADGDKDSAAITIGRYLLDRKGTVTTAPLWVDTFFKVQNAIRYFMAGKKLTVIKGVKEEAYPLKANAAVKITKAKPARPAGKSAEHRSAS
jgi:hypothetical protein